ncbi:MAG: T9SS type A sorting domain-containing protein [candidate division WOR-3 bacterium]
MKKCLIFFIFVLGSGQAMWEREVIDTVSSPSNFAVFNSLALDTSGIPGVVYCDDAIHKIFYARRLENEWQKEIADSGFSVSFGYSLIYDNNNIPHMSYYRVNDQNSQYTLLCYAFRDYNGWHISVIDTIWYRFPGWTDIKSSIALDTLGLPGIAYIQHDSIEAQYIKYAHYNGVIWEISTVEYNGQSDSRDWSPTLKFDKHNIPHIAFREQIGYGVNSLKIYTYDSLNNWVMKWIEYIDLSARSLDFELDKDQYPHLAYDAGGDLEYRWWDGSTWHIDTLLTIGWVGVRIALELDNYDRPHIAVKPAMQSKAIYYYKDITWHVSLLCDSSDGVFTCDLGLEMDKYNTIHAVYSCDSFITGFFKHAWRGLVGIEEVGTRYTMQDAGLNMKVYPSVSYGLLSIEYNLRNGCDAELIVYDITGATRKSIKIGESESGNYRKILNLTNLSGGIYFLVIRQNNKQVSKKFILVK